MSAESSGGTDSTKLIGSIMVLVGLGFFVVVFATIFPVLTDPPGAYDRWFPDDDSAEPTSPTGLEVEPTPGPRAGFGWESVAVDAAGTALSRVRLRAEESRGSTEIVEWSWELGDGSTGSGQSVVHDYSRGDNYTVRLTVRDADGGIDTVSGQVVVPSTGSAAGSIGRIDELTAIAGGEGLDGFGDDITSSLQEAVGSVGDDLNSTLDTALGSIGAAVRGGVVVALFGLAALAATIVGWRTAKIGVLLLTGGGEGRPTVVRRLERGRHHRDESDGTELEIVA